MFVQQLSHRARQNAEEHQEEEVDNHGKRNVAYSYRQDGSNVLHVEKSVRTKSEIIKINFNFFVFFLSIA